MGDIVVVVEVGTVDWVAAAVVVVDVVAAIVVVDVVVTVVVDDVDAVVKMVTVERCKEIVTEILIVNQVIRYKLKTILFQI